MYVSVNVYVYPYLYTLHVPVRKGYVYVNIISEFYMSDLQCMQGILLYPIDQFRDFSHAYMLFE